MPLDVLGLTVADLPEGWQPAGVVVLVKCLVADELAFRMCVRVSEGLTVWEAAGMAGCMEADAKTQYVKDVGGS